MTDPVGRDSGPHHPGEGGESTEGVLPKGHYVIIIERDGKKDFCATKNKDNRATLKEIYNLANHMLQEEGKSAEDLRQASNILKKVTDLSKQKAKGSKLRKILGKVLNLLQSLGILFSWKKSEALQAKLQEKALAQQAEEAIATQEVSYEQFNETKTLNISDELEKYFSEELELGEGVPDGQTYEGKSISGNRPEDAIKNLSISDGRQKAFKKAIATSFQKLFTDFFVLALNDLMSADNRMLQCACKQTILNGQGEDQIMVSGTISFEAMSTRNPNDKRALPFHVNYKVIATDKTAFFQELGLVREGQ